MIRKKLARFLANIALKIDPECKEANDFYAKQMVDLMITGHSATRINPASFFENPSLKDKSE